jgi:hypothetical protein
MASRPDTTALTFRVSLTTAKLFAELLARSQSAAKRTHIAAKTKGVGASDASDPDCRQQARQRPFLGPVCGQKPWAHAGSMVVLSHGQPKPSGGLIKAP